MSTEELLICPCDLDEPFVAKLPSFVEMDTATPEEQASEARYRERERAIELAAEAQIAELIAEESFREEDEPNPYHGTGYEEY